MRPFVANHKKQKVLEFVIVIVTFGIVKDSGPWTVVCDGFLHTYVLFQNMEFRLFNLFHRSDRNLVCLFCFRNTKLRLHLVFGTDFRRNFSLRNPGIPTELESIPSTSVFRGIFFNTEIDNPVYIHILYVFLQSIC